MSKYWLSGRISPCEQYPAEDGAFIINLVLDSSDTEQARKDATTFVSDQKPDYVEKVGEWTVNPVPEDFGDYFDVAAFFDEFTETDHDVSYIIKRYDNIKMAGEFYVKFRKALNQ